jgi:hypothetical protein
MKLVGFWFVVALLLNATSCQQTKHQASTDGATLENKDRPSEEGAGVPGYSIYCAVDEDRSTESQLEVGCLLADQSGQRVETPDDSWAFYEVRLTEKPTALSISKSVPASRQRWDILFGYRGLPLGELRQYAAQSTFVYEYQTAAGQIVELESGGGSSFEEPGEQPDATCSIGLSRNGVCYFKTSSSCSKQCANYGSTPHPSVINMIGSGDAQNAETCRDLYVEMDSNPNLELKRVQGPFGNGCHQHKSTVIWDETQTDPGVPPPPGANTLCACQGID